MKKRILVTGGSGRFGSILKKLKDNEIECYIIPGSHDFSPSGKTMIDVFENSGLVINVMKTERTEDKLKLGATTITCVLGSSILAKANKAAA